MVEFNERLSIIINQLLQLIAESEEQIDETLIAEMDFAYNQLRKVLLQLNQQ